VRFMDRLVVEYDLDPALGAATLPALLLQPVVENAIKHGVSASTGTATLRIRSARDGDELVLTVANTHAGASTAEGFGIGLRNVRDRLAAAYPGRHGFEAGPSADGWWRVRIRIRLEEGA
jgi:two-component system LytT family sensor kinase